MWRNFLFDQCKLMAAPNFKQKKDATDVASKSTEYKGTIYRMTSRKHSSSNRDDEHCKSYLVKRISNIIRSNFLIDFGLLVHTD